MRTRYTIEEFEAIEEAYRTIAQTMHHPHETRAIREQADRDICQWVYKRYNAGISTGRPRDARAFLYRKPCNLGTNRWPDIHDSIEIVDLKDIEETAETYRTRSGRHYWYKSSILGWLF